MRVATPLPLVLVSLLAGCATTRTHVAPTSRSEVQEPGASVEDPAYRVFLLGDVGVGGPDDAEPVLAALRERLRGAGDNAAVVFLGDQLPAGMPDSGAAGRADAEDRLRRIAAAVDGFDGGVYLVAGERDWSAGPEAVRRQERFVEGLLGREDAFLPGGALGGPLVIELEDGPVLVGIDTPWWFEGPDTRPTGAAGDFDAAVPGDVLAALEDILAEYDEENVLIVGHHPVRSRGPRSGVYPLSTYLLPPVLGAALPLYRAFIGSEQDLASGPYRDLRAAMETVLRTHNGVVYAAAHEHTLEAHRISGVATRRHLVVSGTAADADPVSPEGTLFTSGRNGFLVLRYGEDGRVALEVVEVDGPESRGDVVAALRGVINAELDSDVPDDVSPEDLPPRIGTRVTAAADSNFLAGPTHEFFFGRGYREAWAAPVDVPVLDLGTFAGGLTPVKQGGGLQSVSIRFAGEDGHEYQVRLLRKRAAESLPPELQTPVVRDLVHDQTSATIPYGALSAASLLDAVGVFHAEPQIVYVPDDPRLGRFREMLANQLALIEMRPDNDMSDRPEFGRSDDVVSTAKLEEEMREDHDHLVDQPAYLRARLMDLMMGDWDRHADQWRWAGFDPGQLDASLTGEDATRGKIYVPIPRDRDFAFYRIGGLFPGMAKYFQAKLQNYEEHFGSIRGLTFSGIPLDRRYLSELEWADWEEAVAHLQGALTDEAIEDAFRQWPPAVHERYGAEAVSDFRARREGLPRAAERFYGLLAQSPDVMGSDQREHVTVHRAAEGSTRITVRHANSEGEPGRTLFDRTFVPGETREVRVWAQGGRDWLEVEGDGPARILVRFVGGAGDDTVRDRAGSGGVIYYDDARGNDVTEAGDLTLRLSEDPTINRYEPFDYERYAVRSFYPQIAYDRTDGVLPGIGIVDRRPRFRGRPIVHDLSARVGTTTGAIEGAYRFRDPDRWGRGHGVALELRGATPRNVRNFYGFGNDTESPLSDDLYNLRVARVRAEADYVHRLAGAIELRVGPALSYADVRADSTGFAGLPASGLQDDDFEPMLHGGATGTLELARVDDAVNPRLGLRWTSSLSGWSGLSEFADPYGIVGSDLAIYASPIYRPQVTIAARIGVRHALGDPPVFDAPAIGGSTLRGYIRERFTGNTAAYQSAELRVKLLTLSTAIIPLEIGGIGFVDNGRVWADDVPEGSFFEGWHQGYGGGVWVGFVNRLLMSATVGTSPEGTTFSVGLGFNY